MSKTTIQDALDAAVGSVSRLPVGRSRPEPLAPLPLTLSAVAIAVGALALTALITAATVLILFGALGRAGFNDLLAEARFSPPLKARVYAFAVSAIYVGVAVATLAAARLRGGRRGWPGLLAAGPARWRGREAVAIALLTLGYAAGFTLVQVLGRDRHLLVAGPTDFLLLGTLAANLVVLAPLAEEMFFRGWLYTALRARWRFLPSFAVATAAFVAIHWDANHRHMLRVLPLALGLGLLRERTGSIRSTVALHAAYNGAIVAITLAAT